MCVKAAAGSIVHELTILPLLLIYTRYPTFHPNYILQSYKDWWFGANCIVLNSRGSKFSWIASFENFIEIILRIHCMRTLHAACQKLSLKYFCEQLKIREICEIKDPQKIYGITFLVRIEGECTISMSWLQWAAGYFCSRHYKISMY